MLFRVSLFSAWKFVREKMFSKNLCFCGMWFGKMFVVSLLLLLLSLYRDFKSTSLAIGFCNISYHDVPHLLLSQTLAIFLMLLPPPSVSSVVTQAESVQINSNATKKRKLFEICSWILISWFASFSGKKNFFCTMKEIVGLSLCSFFHAFN